MNECDRAVLVNEVPGEMALLQYSDFDLAASGIPPRRVASVLFGKPGGRRRQEGRARFR